MTSEPPSGGASALGAVASARAAAVIQVLIAVGFGGGAMWATLHLLQNGELPLTPWGFRAMSGPFEVLGQGPFAVLCLTLAVVCALDVLAGIWLWRLQRRGFRLGLVTALPQLVLGLGFALPFLLAALPLRLLLAFLGRPSLS